MGLYDSGTPKFPESRNNNGKQLSNGFCLMSRMRTTAAAAFPFASLKADSGILAPTIRGELTLLMRIGLLNSFRLAASRSDDP